MRSLVSMHIIFRHPMQKRYVMCRGSGAADMQTMESTPVSALGELQTEAYSIVSWHVSAVSMHVIVRACSSNVAVEFWHLLELS